MSGRRLWKWIGLGLALGMFGSPAKAKVVSKDVAAVTIWVYNDAAVPWGTIEGAEEEASYVFHEAGIDVEWRNCPAASTESTDAGKSRSCGEATLPEHLDLRIVKRSVGSHSRVMGISFLSEDGGSQADLF